jgi:alkanesulfonate monooxygenase SsuD/methylene tetrahydromethanopterin reductase-like flavin-dependent oxidoreductase (luciferase family)
MESGIQLHLPTYRNVSLRELLKLGQLAHGGGIQQLWVTDNLQSRNAFVVLSALAGVVPVRLGTAVLVQYFRSPLDVADAASAISELMEGRELSLGISRGNPSTHLLVDSPKPVTMLRETADALHQLLAGERVQFAQYPTLATYFNIVPQHAYQLNFAPQSPVRLYCGGNAPLSLAVAGTSMDGIVFGWTFLAAARSGRLGGLLKIAEDAAREAGRPVPLPRVAEIKIYVDADDAAARAYCRRAVAGRMVGLFERGYTGDDYARLGVEYADMQRLFEAGLAGASGPALSELITDSMIDALFVAGDPTRCRERLAEVAQIAHQHGFHQLMFSELGSDVETSVHLRCEEIIPVM